MDLRIEIMRVWKCRRAFVIPIIVGWSFGFHTKGLTFTVGEVAIPVS